MMNSFSAVVERDQNTGLLVGYVPGFPGAHSQAESLDELRSNLREVIAMLLEQSKAPNRRWRRWAQIFTDQHPHKDISPICVYLRNLRSTPL